MTRKRSKSISRRGILQAGVLGATGLTLADSLRLAHGEAEKKTTADAILFLNLAGGPAHLDTLDMKENLPEETRSEFKPISSKLAGLPVCEHLPKIAAAADQFTLIRGISHTTGDHPQGQAYIAAGNRPNPAVKYPSYGSVIMNELPGDPKFWKTCALTWPNNISKRKTSASVKSLFYWDLPTPATSLVLFVAGPVSRPRNTAINWRAIRHKHSSIPGAMVASLWITSHTPCGQ